MFFYRSNCPHCHACLKAMRKTELMFVPIPHSLKAEKIDIDLAPSYRNFAYRIAKRLGETGGIPTPLMYYGSATGIPVVKAGIFGDDVDGYENFYRGLINSEARIQGITNSDGSPYRLPRKKIVMPIGNSS